MHIITIHPDEVHLRLIVGHHGGGNVGGSDNVGLGLDGRLDDLGVVGVGDQGDDKVVLGNGGIQSNLIVDIQGDSSGVGVTTGELLSNSKTSGSYMIQV